jgi:hypothetical protein
MIMEKTIAQELVANTLYRGQTIIDDDGISMDKAMRMGHCGDYVLIITATNLMTLFENKNVVFTILIRDTEHDVADLLLRAYNMQNPESKFEYL